MSTNERFRTFLGECPLVAIIRGLTPNEAEAVGAAIFAVGIRIIEVPLNSPDPFESIRRLAQAFGDRALIGAGTVLDIAEVTRVAEVGGQLVVSPNVNPEVIEASVAAGLVSAPGFFTPTEAHVALRSGAHCLKLFPAEGASPAVLKAQRAILPKDLPILVVGGVKPDTMLPWREAGASGFGLGSGLYVPGRALAEIEVRGRAYVEALKV